MSRNYFVLQLFFIIQIFSFVYSNGIYTINAPGTIKSNRKYTVCISLHNVFVPVTVRVGIEGISGVPLPVQEVTLQPLETKMLDFYPQKLESYKRYDLVVEGVKGLHFRNYTEIGADPNAGTKIYIETDKGTYKPGDLLRFRVIVLDEHTRPMNIIEPIKVQIFDGAQNRVKQFKDIRLNKGAYADEFQISKEPVLGGWHIKVLIGGKYAEEKVISFEVKKYTLPKFQVQIETDQNFAIENRIIKIEVSGKYTYNKPVEGEVELQMRIGYPVALDIPTQTAAIVDFKAKFEVEIYSLMSDEDRDDDSTLHVTAFLKEKDTNIVRNASTQINLKKERYKITIPNEKIELRNRKPYRMQVKLQHWNDTVINDPLEPVYMEHGSNTYESKLDTNGAAYFEFDHDPLYMFRFHYKNSSATQYSIYSPPDEDENKNENEFKSNSIECRLSLKRKRTHLKSVLEINVESNREIPYLIYTLTAHANIIKYERVQLNSNQHSYTIRIIPSIEMVPESYLYVHYIINSNLIFCEMKIELPRELENQLSISAPQNVKPGENITMTINAQLDSKVFIAAVDLSSVLLNAGNKIHKNNIMRDLIMDKSYSGEGMVLYPGTLSGIVTLTDAHYTVLIPMIVLREKDRSSGANFVIGGGINVRSYFPESWIYQDFEVVDEVTTINLKVPDTITTWIVTAFSINERTGLGVIEPAVKITAFKQFFISTNLPYSIKRGEYVSIPTRIFNYHNKSLSTEVEMMNSLNEFKFVDENSNMTTNLVTVKRSVIVPPNSAESVNFLINPRKLGNIDILVTAKNKLFADGILQKLPVEADGETILNNHDIYLTLMPEENSTANFKANIPLNTVPDSTYLQLSMSGNVLLPSLENLDNLVNKPTGCGEQNMIHFAPDILVLEYLSATHEKSKYPNLVTTAKKYVESGYQQQLKFRHKDGGYSVFGSGRSQTPSNWLTAYVIRFFIKAIRYLPIESHIIESGLDFLSAQQSSNGQFIDAGYLFSPAHQNRYGFTAFVLLSFMENAKYAKKYKGVIQKGLDFLASNSNDVDDIYSLAIMATAFTMAKHEHAPVILNKILPLAKKENGLQWWTDNKHGSITDIETTSYILLALLDVPGNHLPIAKWLLEQRNSHGGFKSTQDTVVGLQALIKFAQFFKPLNDTLTKVSYRAFDEKKNEIESGIMGLDHGNLMVLQHQELPPLTRSLEMLMSGGGNVFLQFSYQYNEIEVPMRRSLVHANQVLPKSFIIKTTTESSVDSPSLTMDVCFKYQPLDDSVTNMIIAKINLPSGYFMNSENLEDLESGDVVERVDYEKLDLIVLYFGYMKPNTEICVNIVADKKDDVRNLKPSMIEIYDYYHSDRREVTTYQVASN